MTGITGLIYNIVRAVTETAGDRVDLMLEKSGTLFGNDQLSLSRRNAWPPREAFIAALNGVVGDHLAATENPLAIEMKLRSRGGQPLDQSRLCRNIDDARGKVLLMIHGLCMNDMQWKRQGHDHGEAIAAELGYYPIYLHYNTGLHISENGMKLSNFLETIVSSYMLDTGSGERDGEIRRRGTSPKCLQNNRIQSFNGQDTRAGTSPKCLQNNSMELVIIGHSMGGLVARSACHYGKEAGHMWLKHLGKLIFLGTPHHGSPVAKGGSWIDGILSFNPYSRPFARLGKIRSSGL
ncbi:MAG: hypothetical protein HQK66_02900, partial [Desulfamplus sp.]|nr:hypothetical protein [Desulfamplus sp.]